MKQLRYLLIVFAFASCISKSNSVGAKEVAEFDSKYGAAITELIDKIQMIANTDSSFCVEFRPQSQDFYFYKIDSAKNGLGYFQVDFSTSDNKRKLLNETIIHEICFNFKNRYGFMKAFLLKNNDKAVHIEVLAPDNRSQKLESDSIVFQSKRCLYYFKDAW